MPDPSSFVIGTYWKKPCPSYTSSNTQTTELLLGPVGEAPAAEPVADGAAELAIFVCRFFFCERFSSLAFRFNVFMDAA